MTVAETKAVNIWRTGVFDTRQIAQMLGVNEAWVYRVVSSDADRRHALRQREAQRA